MKILLSNRALTFNYEIIKEYEAGIVLSGTEVKSLVQGRGDLSNTYVVFRKNEAYVINMHINKYSFGNIHNHEEKRSRKLLLHKHEILKIALRCKQEHLSLIPHFVYLSKRHKIKLSISLARGKKLHDKRQAIKERDQKRELQKYY